MASIENFEMGACNVDCLIDGVLRTFKRSRIVSEAESSAVLSHIAATYVADPSAVHWWSSLKSEGEVFGYDEDSSGAFEWMDRVLAKFEGDDVYFVITDDSPPPWPVLCVNKSELTSGLQELPFFEFMVASKDLDALLIDTHMNRSYFIQKGEP